MVADAADLVHHLHVESANLSMFPPTKTSLDWVRDPHRSASAAGTDMTSQELEEPTELRQDRGLKLRIANLPLESLRLSARKEIPHSVKQSYFNIAPIFQNISEPSFSSLTARKTKNRDRLSAVEVVLRACVRLQFLPR